MMKPGNLFCGMCCRDILSFGNQQCDEFLLLQWLRNCPTIYKNDWTQNCLPVFLQCAICVCEPYNPSHCSPISQLPFLCTLQVMKYPLHHLPVSPSQILQILWQHTNDKHNVQSCSNSCPGQTPHQFPSSLVFAAWTPKMAIHLEMADHLPIVFALFGNCRAKGHSFRMKSPSKGKINPPNM